jgi:hypothetical protein
MGQRGNGAMGQWGNGAMDFIASFTHCLIASLLKVQFEGPPGVDLERTGCGDASACL